jgi:hypothetical protein
VKAFARPLSVVVPAAPLVLLLLAGCGYSASDPAVGQTGPTGGLAGYQWKSLYRDDVRTVAVPIFSNRSFQRGVEFRLTKAIVNQIESQSPYKVVPRDRADTVLEGEVTDVFVRTYSADPRTGVPQDQFYLVRVNFTWKDLRTGKILAERRRFEQSATFYPTLGEGRFVGSQQNVERLAVAIVQELQAEW